MNTLTRISRSTLVVSFILIPALVNAQTPVCGSPGCNSVTSDFLQNTGVGTAAFPNDVPDPNCGLALEFCGGGANTAAGYYAMGQSGWGNSNSAFGAFALTSNVGGNLNTAVGYYALASNVGPNKLYSGTEPNIGGENTAVGASALLDNTEGNQNAGVGANALYSNTTGNTNVAVGYSALYANTTASGNTAVGYNALAKNATAANNSAFGAEALQANVTGTENVASGAGSLRSSISGDHNSAYGVEALYGSTTASNNAALGYRALYRSTTGQDNAATGFAALLNNTTGNGNTGVGYNALNVNTTGSNNIAIGYNAGYSVTGSNNIDIGSMGSAGESGVIRIGGSSQSAVYIAGITSTHLTGAPVYVDSKGQLGVLASSERYKTGVATLGDTSEKLRQLRPVSYHLKNDANGDVQYGLIAEEVYEVLPELVIRDESGTIQGVRYDELAPLLVGEVQRQQDRLATQASEIRNLKEQMAKLQQLTVTMQTALADVNSRVWPRMSAAQPLTPRAP